MENYQTKEQIFMNEVLIKTLWSRSVTNWVRNPENLASLIEYCQTVMKILTANKSLRRYYACWHCTLKTFLAKHSGATECISLILLLSLHAFNKFQANYITWKRLQTFSRFKIVLINFCFKITSVQPFLPWFSWEMSQKTRKLELSLFFLPWSGGSFTNA